MPAFEKRSARITSRKLAGSSPLAVRRAYHLDPHDHVRSVVASLGSEANRENLYLLAEPFQATYFGPSGETEFGDLAHPSTERIYLHGFAHVVRPRAIQRIGSRTHNGYPLNRTLLVTFNHDKDGVIAELREVTDRLNAKGIGGDEDSALRDLERQFDAIVWTKVRIPPHARKPEDRKLVDLINHLVDWERFEAENPPERPLWGKIISRDDPRNVRVHWLIGPRGVRETEARVPRAYLHPVLRGLRPGRWFKGSVKEYPDRVEWIDPPSPVPAPTDKEAARKAWDAIPTIRADQEGAWPLERD